MCGFSGLVFASANQLMGAGLSRERFDACAARVAHRGGDGEGSATLAHAWLAHHRLAFQDVAQGGQPFTASDGDATIVFNGEVYNHATLRPPLERAGVTFRTRSDTETLVELVRAEGIAAASDKLEGEYAFLVAHEGGRRVVASRDAFGVKPLFFWFEGLDTASLAMASPTYTFRAGAFAFASEMKALPIRKAWNRDGALRQFTGLFEPLRTPLEGVIALPGGAVLEAVLEGGAYTVRIALATEPVRIRARGLDAPEGRDLREAFAAAMGESVVDRLLSDVELGVYLSGGVDSKTVGHELSRHLRAHAGTGAGARPLKSFTVGFAARAFDETAEALAFARAQGFDAHVLEVDDAALAYSYPIAVAHSENIQPYTNGAAKWWLSRFARRSVHGVLTGDGADELLCGYPSFRYAAWWKFALRGRSGATTDTSAARIARVPLGSRWRDALYVKRFLSEAADPWLAGSSSEGRGDDFVDSLAAWGVAHPLFGQVRAIARTLFPSASEADAWLAEQGPSVRGWFALGFPGGVDTTDPENALLCWQAYFCRTHLPVQVLNWVGDRMEMANTLEGRTPFLSKRLRSLVRSLPDRALVAGFLDKAILRRSYLPRLGAFARTPKRQFGAPFLDNETLLARYPAAPALSAIGVDPIAALGRLRGGAGRGSAAPATDARSRYEATHVASALQTAVSFGIVHRALVEERPPPRDLALEENVLARGTRTPPP